MIRIGLGIDYSEGIGQKGRVRGRVRGRVTVTVRSRGIGHRDSRARAENGSKDGAIKDRMARRRRN
jgi:hypothetical protein